MMRQGDIFSCSSTNEDFEVGAELGRGGFGIVFNCSRMSDTREFVCKVAVQDDELRNKKIKNEHRILRDLEKKGIPNVVRAVSLASFDNGISTFPVLVMEKVIGKNMNSLIKSPQSSDLVKEMLVVIGESIIQIHEAGYIHRDLSPDNIMVEDDGNGGYNITIIDFGIAAVKEDSQTFALTTSVAMKPFWAPPEQAKGTISIGNDIFGLGAIGYYLLIGSEKCRKDSQNAITPPYNPSNHLVKNSLQTEHLFDVITKSTQEKRRDRFATMSDFVTALKGGRPAEDFPRFIVDGKAIALKPEINSWTIGRKGYGSDIQITEPIPGGAFISRTHVNVTRNGPCNFKIEDIGTKRLTLGYIRNRMPTFYIEG